MIKNYLITTLRNLWRNKVHSFLNISGLAIGTTVCLLILIFVNYEMNFDRFHKKYDRIYRLYEITSFDGLPKQLQALTMHPMGPTLQEEYPEIESFVRFANMNNTLIQVKNDFFYLNQSYLVDENVFEVFDFELIKGDPKTALREPNTIVITSSTAKRLFGHENPVGKEVIINESESVNIISGVVKDPPDDSHIQFEALFAMNGLPANENRTSWGVVNNWVFTYLVLSENASVAKLEKDFPNMLKKYAGDNFTEAFNIFLQPLANMHLDSKNMTLDFMNFHTFDRSYLYVFASLAFLVLLLAIINFISLSTARSITRAKEIGVRKSIGAHRWQLIAQFIGESIVYAAIATTIAGFLVELSLPYVSELTQRSLVFNPLQYPELFLLLVGMSIIIGILSGIYPAFYISAYKPVKVLKGKIYTTRARFSLRNVLVVLQFAIAVCLIISTLFVVKQLNYLQNKNLGFNKEQVILVSLGGVDQMKYKPLKSELMKGTHILDVTAADQRLGRRVRQLHFEYQGDSAKQSMATYVINVDHNYLDFYDIELSQGRKFSKNLATDSARAFIVNEAMAQSLGVPVNEMLGNKFGFAWVEELGTIVGISKNFNHNSLHHTVDPLTLMFNEGWGYTEMAIRLDKNHTAEALEEVQNQWDVFFPGVPFEYTFLNQHFISVYQDEARVSQVVGIFTILAILVAALGLFGLTAFTMQQRTKEIGIRKVLGASIMSILVLVMKDFIKLVVIAFLIACPIAYWFISDWLQDYAFRITITPAIFLATGLGVIFIAILTILYHAGKSTSVNPIEVLKDE